MLLHTRKYRNAPLGQCHKRRSPTTISPITRNQQRSLWGKSKKEEKSSPAPVTPAPKAKVTNVQTTQSPAQALAQAVQVPAQSPATDPSVVAADILSAGMKIAQDQITKTSQAVVDAAREEFTKKVSQVINPTDIGNATMKWVKSLVLHTIGGLVFATTFGGLIIAKFGLGVVPTVVAGTFVCVVPTVVSGFGTAAGGLNAFHFLFFQRRLLAQLLALIVGKNTSVDITQLKAVLKSLENVPFIIRICVNLLFRLFLPQLSNMCDNIATHPHDKMDGVDFFDYLVKEFIVPSFDEVKRKQQLWMLGSLVGMVSLALGSLAYFGFVV